MFFLFPTNTCIEFAMRTMGHHQWWGQHKLSGGVHKVQKVKDNHEVHRHAPRKILYFSGLQNSIFCIFKCVFFYSYRLGIFIIIHQSFSWNTSGLWSWKLILEMLTCRLSLLSLRCLYTVIKVLQVTLLLGISSSYHKISLDPNLAGWNQY